MVKSTKQMRHVLIPIVSPNIVNEFQEGAELDKLQSFLNKNLIINKLKRKIKTRV